MPTLELVQAALIDDRRNILQFIWPYKPAYPCAACIWPTIIRNGHTILVQWLAQLKPQDGPQMVAHTCAAAAEGEHLGLL